MKRMGEILILTILTAAIPLHAENGEKKLLNLNPKLNLNLKFKKSSKPVSVTVVLKDRTEISGTLSGITDDKIVINASSAILRIDFSRVDFSEIYRLGKMLCDLTREDDNIELVRFCLGYEMYAHGARHLRLAIKIAIKPNEEIKKKLIQVEAKIAKLSRRPEPDDRKGIEAWVQMKLAGKIPMYDPVKKKDASKTLADAESKFEQASQIISSLHKIETDHFIIYSAWKPSLDAALKDFCTKAYNSLCEQFDLDKNDNIWVGKLVIYNFWTRRDYDVFSTKIMELKLTSGLKKSTGYQIPIGSGGAAIVLGPIRTRAWFHEMLVHEATHAFLQRFGSDGRLTLWVNEGLAEHVAATLVTGALANSKREQTIRKIKQTNKSIQFIFDENYKWKTKHFEYGIAQSLIKFLHEKNPRAFRKFILFQKLRRMDAKEALAEAFGLTTEQLEKEWKKTLTK